jgi:hypothetical protein
MDLLHAVRLDAEGTVQALDGTSVDESQLTEDVPA